MTLADPRELAAADLGTALDEVPAGPPRGGFRAALRRLWRHRSGKIGGGLVALIVFCAIFAPWLTPYDPLKLDMIDRLQPPSWSHWLGTDELGRDLLTRVIYGTRYMLLVSCVATAIGATGGILLGLLASAGGKWTDMAVMRIVDIMLAFPYILLLLAIIAILGPSLVTALVAVGVASMPGYARLVRGEALSVRESEYVEAMRVLGAGNWRITFGTVLPNIASPLVIYTSYTMPLAVLSAAALSFLGLGAQPPLPEWGAMLVQSRSFLRTASWVVAAPGFAIFFAILGLNLLGNALRDVLDPKART
ncbi:ABC transporter permease [Oceaniglobus roseus]|uniref:ABC transporter permease n=1 Tax=Oceaniglobus roseus TaxID=1737570 RepID=UPI000C7F1574|nr:ABC transporter permease [Kandeliimicrobium roseum]